MHRSSAFLPFLTLALPQPILYVGFSSNPAPVSHLVKRKRQSEKLIISARKEHEVEMVWNILSAFYRDGVSQPDGRADLPLDKNTNRVFSEHGMHVRARRRTKLVRSGIQKVIPSRPDEIW